MAKSAIVIGTGPAGSAAAWELSRHGWTVTMLERGRNLRPGLGEKPTAELGTLYGSDEIKSLRAFGFPDPKMEPMTGRTQSEANSGVERSKQGLVVNMGAAVGGTAMHYNAKYPRFWRQDFTQLSDLGPVPGATMADWPISYDDLAPFYDEVEHHLGVQGDLARIPDFVKAQSPRLRDFPMPPNPTGYAAQLLAQGARAMGYSPFPYPAAVNSQVFDGRPACNSCGLCSGFGCTINARNDGLTAYLNPAMLQQRVRVIQRALAYKIETSADGQKAVAVHYYDDEGQSQRISADHILLAGSPIQTARLLLLSANSKHPTGLGNSSDQVGRNMMFHNFIQGGALFDRDIQSLRAQSTTLEIDDLMGPFTGPEVQALGVPYIKGALVQLGSGLPLMTEAMSYAGFGATGLMHKQLMRLSPMRLRIAGLQMVGEDMPQADNRIDLDPTVKDHHGLPVARVTYAPHAHDKAAAQYFAPRLEAMCLAAPGAIAAAVIPNALLSDAAPTTFHQAGTTRMGNDPSTSVCNKFGRLHDMDNVHVVDGSTFVTFPGFNPTLTILANSLRISRALAQGAPA
ncbi:MAG: GMC family oxidoreductase [Pseudomonadota bacterium]